MPEPTFQIPKEIITPIIQAHINDAVIKALDGPSNIVTTAILSVINMKVDSEGKPSHYSDGRPWIDWCIGRAIRDAAQSAVQKVVGEHRTVIEEALILQLQKKNSPLVKQMVETMATGLTQAVVGKWNFHVSFGDTR